MPIAIYACETWTLRETEKKSLLTFEMRCLRAILGISRLQRIKNVSIRKELRVEKTIVDAIQNRRLRYLGHVNRRDVNSALFQAYKGNFTGRRPFGRPPLRWSDQIRKDTGLPIETAERRTMDRQDWRRRNIERARGKHA